MLSPDPRRPAGMAAIATNAVEISKYIHDLQFMDRVVISVFSSPTNHVVSGDMEAISALVSHVKKAGIRATLLNVDQGRPERLKLNNSLIVVSQGFHSHCIDAALPELRAWLGGRANEIRPLQMPLFSTVLGRQVAPHQSLEPHYWVRFIHRVQLLHSDRCID
jgi:acyl transferase domain-containing protein